MSETPAAKKALGQHWLFDRPALEAMVEAAGITGGDTVLEIGAGFGTLTNILVKKAAKVIAVEFDTALAQKLKQQVTANNLQIVEGDILKFDFSQLPNDYKIAANIPYYLTSHLLRIIGETPNQPSRAALLVQKEVAERVAASPGGMSLLSVSVQFYYECALGQVVPAELFTPMPKVDSQILILERHAEPPFTVDTKKFFRLVKAGFAGRRKMLRGSISAGLHLGKAEAEALLKQAGIDPSLRAQALSLQDWYRLYQSVMG